MPHEPAPLAPRPFPGARLRPARGLRIAYGLGALLVAIVAAIAVAFPELRAIMGILGPLLLVPLGVGLAQLRRNSPPGGGGVEVRGEGVFVEGRLALPRATIERAVVTRDARGVAVSIQRRKGFVSVIDVGSAGEGQALVEALGLSAAQARSTFPLDSPLATALPRWCRVLYWGLLVPILFVPALLGVPLLTLPLAVAWYVPLIGALMPAQLMVGLDGLLLRWLWRRRLVRFEDLQGVDHDGERLVLSLAGRRREAYPVRMIGQGFEGSSLLEAGFGSKRGYLDAMVARVREAVDTSRAQAGRAPAAALLRQGRALDAWVGALRGVLGRGAQGFRGAETVPEHLWATVEDGGAEPATRAAAAIALGPTLDAADRTRMRGVARVVVSPPLRVAIEATADGDDEAEYEALAALEADRDARRAG